MLFLCKTSRGRIACGLGGCLIALLALVCLWALSPAVTAGDGPPAPGPTQAKPPVQNPDLPPVPAAPPSLPAAPPHLDGAVQPAALPLIATPPSPPPATGTTAAPSVGPREGIAEVPLRPVPLLVAPVAPSNTPPLPPVPSAENLDIKQLMARLNGIREGRARLDEAERQTIQTIKRKLQEQKKALAQLELDLHQLGIALEENAPDRGPIQQAGFETMPRPAPSPEPERLGPPRIKP